MYVEPGEKSKVPENVRTLFQYLGNSKTIPKSHALHSESLLVVFLIFSLRVTYTGNYRIIQHYFSERTSQLRVFFKNVQLRLFICLGWSSRDVSHVYGSSGREVVNLKHWDAF